MAQLGRSFPQRSRILGIPPTEAPGYAAPTAPVGAMLGVTSGGRQGRGTPTKPLVLVSPRPVAASPSDLTITAVAASSTYSAPAATLTVTITATPGLGTWSAPTAGVSTGAVIQHGGNRTRFKGKTLADREIDAHVARLLETERRRADDEALGLLACA